MRASRLGRAETRTVAIAAAPEHVFALLADPRRLPDWAPAFAVSIEHEHGDVWRVHSERGEGRVVVLAARAQGTVDVVRAERLERGLFARVVPSPGGSALSATLCFDPGVDGVEIDAQMDVVAAELRAVRELCER